MLSDITREIQELCKSEDPLEFATVHGTIVNRNVKRRSGRRPPGQTTTSIAIKGQSVKPKADLKELSKTSNATAKQEAKPLQSSTTKDFFSQSKEKTKEKPKSTGATASTSSNKESTPVPAPSALKRESSSIFKSFAKAKPKLKREETDSSVAAESPAEDSPMRDVSDDEEETYVPPVLLAKENTNSELKEKRAREAALRAMMDDSEEETVVAAKSEVEKVDKSDVEIQEDIPTAAVSDRRRRGRRRVMKKKTVQDEDGYLGMSYSTILLSEDYLDY
jgi:DNA polymerase delta subunit 3